MKINEYAANVSEYTEVVDTPYNHKGTEQELDERPVGLVKGGLQKLGSKLLPGSYGDRMQGKVETGQQANQLYKEFNKFLGKSGYQSTDDAIKAFLQQKGINVNVDGIIKQVAPTPAAPPAAPIAESADQLNRILILSGRAPKNVLNETKVVKKKVLTEAVALNRGALSKIFMQVAQQMSGGASGEPAAASGAAPAQAGGGGSAPAPAAPRSATTAPAPRATAASGGDFGGDGPAAAPAPTTAAPASSGGFKTDLRSLPPRQQKGFKTDLRNLPPKAPAVQPPAPAPAAAPTAAKPGIGSRIAGAASKGLDAAAKGIGAAAGTAVGAAANGVRAFKGALANRRQQAAPPAPAPAAAAEPAADAAPVSNPLAAEPTTTGKKQLSQNPEAIRSAKRRAAAKEKAAAAQGDQQTTPAATKPRMSVRAATNKPRVSVRAATNAPAANPNMWSMGTSNVTGKYGDQNFVSKQKEQTNEDVKLQRLLSKISMKL